MLEIVLRDAVGESMSEEERDAWWDRVEWCCPGRHGVLRNIPESDIGKVRHVISYRFGAYDNDGLWWTKNGDGTWSCEFVHMCKIQPAPDYPWDWCGKTHLFQGWQRDLQAVKNIRAYIQEHFPVGTTAIYRDADGEIVAWGQVAGISTHSLAINDFALGRTTIRYDTNPGWSLAAG